MPFIEEPRTLQPLTAIAAEPDAPEVDPSLLTTFGAAFRTQNVVGSWLSSRGAPDPYQMEDGFNSIDYVKDDPKFSPYVEEFAGIFNKKAADAKKAQIAQEEADRRTLDAAGATGIVAQLAAGVVDLPTLIPFGGPLVSGARTAAGTALRIGIAAGIDAGVSEAALQATQATRTGEETALNVGGSIILGGALGGLVGRYLSRADTRALSQKIEGQEAAYDEVDNAFVQGGSVGAAARDKGPLELKDEGLISKLPIVNRQDPLIRLQLGEMETGRQTVRQMAETPLEYKENAAGVATERGGAVETRIKLWSAPLAKSLREVDTHFARYFHGTAEPTSWQRRLSPTMSEWDRVRGGQKMTYKQFKEEVGRAAYMGGEHEIPEVKAAAAVYRNLDETLKKAAIDAKLFPEDVDVVGDISHRFRMYNKEKIVADRGRFADILNDYFTSAQKAAEFRGEEMTVGKRILDSDRVAGQYEQAFSRLDQIEARLASRDEARRRRMDSLGSAQQLRLDVMKTRAPEALVKALRGADETAVMIDTVRESRKAERAAGKKPLYGEKYPIISIIKDKGGVRVGSKLDAELRAMDITPKTFPGLFRKDGGIGDVDNFPRADHEILAQLADDGNSYADPRAIMQAIRDEAGGNPLRTAEKQAADELADNLDRVASEWLDSVGLPPNATVKDVRDFIGRVLGAEKDLSALDAKISRLEGEIEDFDRSTDAIRTERDISASEARTIADQLEELEKTLDEVRDIANTSPRVRAMVDYGRVKRDLFKAKLKERNLQKRSDAIKRLQADGRANDDMLAELAAAKVDLERLDVQIGKLTGKANKLQDIAPKAGDLDKAEEFANLGPGEIRSLVDETINTILGHTDGRVPYDIVAGPRGALKERVLKIETAKIHDFVENDIETVLHSQIRTMAPDIELAKKFGSVDLKEEIRKVNDEADAKIAKATTQKERQRLEAARKGAIRDIEGIRDRLRGTYAMPSDPASLVMRAGRIARNLNYVRLLGGMTISAIPDLGKTVFTHGLTSTFRDGFMPLLTNLKAVKLAADEVKAAGTALDMMLDSRTMAMADITGEFGHHSKFERGLSALSTKFGIVSLMAPWNASLKQFAGMVTMTNLLKASERVAKGTGTADDIRKLAASGIDAPLAKRIWGQFAGRTETTAGDLIPNADPAIRQYDINTTQHAGYGEINGGVYLPHGDNWTDKEALEAFRTAVVRDVDRIIVTPGQDKPLWMSTELGKTVGQFKSFAVSTMQRTMLAGLQQRDAATLNGTMLMMGLGAMAYWAKQTTAGQPVSDKPSVWAVEAFDRAGLAGWLMEVNNIAEKATRGRVGLSAATGQQVSRYATRNVTGAFLGPTADAVSDIFQVSGSIFAGDTTKSDLRKARQLVPLSNLFYIRGLLNQVEGATGDALGLPDTQRK